MAEKFLNFHTVTSITKILSIKWLAKLIRFLEPLAEDPIHNLFPQKYRKHRNTNAQQK